MELKAKQSIKEVDWHNVLPLKNRTIVRMLTISLGAFETVDITDAAIHGAVKSGGTAVGFFTEFILHVNFVGVGRFAIAATTDVSMAGKRAIERNKRIKVVNEKIQLLDAKVYYNQANMWIAADDAKKAFEEADAARDSMLNRSFNAMVNVKSDVDHVISDINKAEQHNPGLTEDLLNILTEEGI